VVVSRDEAALLGYQIQGHWEHSEWAVPSRSMAREVEAGLCQVDLRQVAGEAGRRRRMAGVEGVGWAARGMQPWGMGWIGLLPPWMSKRTTREGELLRCGSDRSREQEGELLDWAIEGQRDEDGHRHEAK
jgi:hypothetical protein